MAIFTGQKATNNSFTGTAIADQFLWAASDLDSRDRASGAGGTDTLRLTTAGVLSSTALAGLSGIERITLAAGKNGLALLDANFAGVAGAKILVTGGAGADAIDARRLTGVNAIDVTAGAGLDVLRGGAGRDTFRFEVTHLDGDTVLGGGGTDQLLLSTAGALLSRALTKVSGVETIQFASGGNAITLRGGNFTDIASGRITITGSAGADGVNAAALGAGQAITVRAGAGADTLVGGAGDDLFIFKAADLALDRVDGRAGADRLVFADAGTVSAAGLNGVRGVETFALASGGNAITMSNTNFIGVAGAKITVTGGAGSDTVNGSGLTGANAIDVTAGAGNDTLRGGAGADVFRFTEDNMTSADTVQGGAGADTLVLSGTGALAGNALAGMSGVETIRLAAGGNALAVLDANFAGVAGGTIMVIGGAGPNLVDAGQLTGFNSIDVTAGKDIDSLTGGAGNDVFRFAATDLAQDDTVQGGGGYDHITLTTAGALAVDALAGMTGIDQINLAAGGNAITLTNANFAVLISDPSGGILIAGSAGSSSIDASSLTNANSIYFVDGGGADMLKGGEGSDRLVLQGGNVFATGDAFDGGGGVIDTIFIDRSMDFLGNTITNVEQLLNFGSNSTSVTISGENAAGLRLFGGLGLNNVNDILTVQLTSGSTTDLSQLALNGADAGDAIKVASGGDGTTVTLSNQIANFGGSSGSDTVLLATGGHYRDSAFIIGGAGNDRIAFDPASTARVVGGADVDTLLVSGAAVVTLATTTAQADGLSLVQGFENVDASASSAAVMLSGRNDLASVLIGGAAGDTITAGTAGAIITGGLGADTLTGGAGDDRFLIRGGEATGDTIDGGTGDDGIEVRATADLSGAAISNIDTLFLAAADATGNFINADVAATVKGSQLAQLSGGIFGNGYFTDSVETLQVNADSTTLDLSGLAFSYWNANDRVEITGTSGADTITGTSRNDVIRGGGGRFDGLSGGGGDDVIGYDVLQTSVLDGGTGNDTVRLDSIDFSDSPASIKIDLLAGDSRVNFTNGDYNSIFVTNFENADFSANVLNAEMIGTNEANSLIGGSAGDDLIGGLGADRLTGGGGADRFVWNNKAEGGDTITDFERGVDKLVFKASVFTVDGAFDTFAYDNGPDIGGFWRGIDLFYSDQILADSTSVLNYVISVDRTINHSFFYVGLDQNSHINLYYIDANGVSPPQALFIADLGAGPAPTLSDFAFI